MRSTLTFLRGALSLALVILFAACLVEPSLAQFAGLAPDALPGVALAVTAPFPVIPELVAVAMGYRNQRLIGDLVLPRVRVNKKEYRYWKWDKTGRFTIPDTKVGRTSRPNEVQFNATEDSGICEDFGLDDPIPQDDIANAPQGIDPRGEAVESITDLILLDREVRVAGLVFDAATYPAANKETLSGTDQFSDFANSSPVEVISDALDVPIMRPNRMVLGQYAWTKLRQHPDIVKAAHGNSGDKGMATREQVAELFELQEVLVGQAFLNTAKKGQTPTMARVWGKHIALLYIDPLANPGRSQTRLTFGATFQFGDRVAGSKPDENIGLRGGERVRAGESVDEKITASDVGYFIEDAVA